jgi:hypothetical protein
MCRIAIAITTIASGGLIRKTKRQEPTWSSQPPRNGAIADAVPLNPDQAPIALARSVSVKLAWMMARLAGVRSAPPTPCRARAAISQPLLGASAHSRDAAANHATPITNTRLRPYLSPQEPPSRISEASVKV